MGKILDLAKKLQALAESGVGGEKTNAEAMLRKLMAEHRITEADLGNVERRYREFRYTDPQNHRLLLQVISTILPRGFQQNMKGYRNDPNLFLLEATDLEYMEIEAKSAFYKQVYAQEQQAFLNAFIQKHRLCPPSDPTDTAPDTTSPAELAKMRKLINSMGDYSYNKQIKS